MKVIDWDKVKSVLKDTDEDHLPEVSVIIHPSQIDEYYSLLQGQGDGNAQPAQDSEIGPVDLTGVKPDQLPKRDCGGYTEYRQLRDMWEPDVAHHYFKQGLLYVKTPNSDKGNGDDE